MTARDVKAQLFLTPEEIAARFRHDGDLKWVYRNARPRGFLHPAARKLGRKLLFSREVIERLVPPA